MDGHRRTEVTDDWIILHKEEHHNLNTSLHDYIKMDERCGTCSKDGGHKEFLQHIEVKCHGKRQSGKYRHR
jgi:hypothetical protein